MRQVAHTLINILPTKPPRSLFHYTMMESGKVNIVLGQDGKCMFSSTVSEYQLFLIIFPEKDGKEHICQINDLMPCTQGCVHLLQQKYHSSDWGYYLVEFAVVDYDYPELVGASVMNQMGI